MDRIEELRKLSLLPTFVESSSSSDDDSVASVDVDERVTSIIKDRASHDNRIVRMRPCVLKPCSDSSTTARAEAAWRAGDLAVRASTLGVSRRRLRSYVAFFESYPRWFTLRSMVSTPEAAERVHGYVERRHGGAWDASASRYSAHHPCMYRRAAPLLQNMTARDFMHVSAYLHLRSHTDAARLVVGNVSDKFYVALRRVYPELPAPPPQP